jgi:hypothetical protein
VNWKGFGRTRLWPNRCNILSFALWDWGQTRKNKLSVAGALSETRAEHFPDTNLDHYHWPRHARCKSLAIIMKLYHEDLHRVVVTEQLFGSCSCLVFVFIFVLATYFCADRISSILLIALHHALVLTTFQLTHLASLCLRYSGRSHGNGIRWCFVYS